PPPCTLSRRGVSSDHRIFRLFLQATNSLAFQSAPPDPELGSIEHLLRQIFDCKSNRLCGACEAPVTYRPVALAAARGEQLGRGVIVKGRDLPCFCHAGSDLDAVQPSTAANCSVRLE